jgi:6-phosphogluconolactonase (cycloisomerase 2 family)
MHKFLVVSRMLLAMLGTIVVCQAQDCVDQSRAKDLQLLGPTYVYAALAGPLNGIGSIAQFRLLRNGTLKPLNPATIAAGGASDDFAPSVVVNPAGRYLYAENVDSETISKYCISVTGTLSRCATLPFEFFAMAFAHKGQIAIVTNTKGITSYRTSATGAMSLISTVPAASAGGPVVVDPKGKFVYVVNESISTISEYSLSVSGRLAPLAPTNTVPTGWLPFYATFSPQGFLYSVDYGAGTISEYSMDLITGALTLTDTVPTGSTSGFGSQPRWISFDPSGSFAYVGNVYDNTISQFSVDAATGVLTRNGADVPTSWAPLQVVVDPSGKFVFSADGDGQIMQFMIKKDGTLAANGSVLIGSIYDGFPFGIMFAQPTIVRSIEPSPPIM